MKQIGPFAATLVCATLVLPRLALAQTTPALPSSITTSDKVESSLGTLDFRDGAPGKETVAKVYDYRATCRIARAREFRAHRV